MAQSIVWFYRDLRLEDHPALTAAAARGAVLPLYIHADSAAEGGASKWWLHHALHDLARTLAKRDIRLILKRGDPLAALRALIAETGAKTVMWNRRYEPDLAARDRALAEALRQEGIEVCLFNSFLLFEPEKIRTQSGAPFKVYTPFSKACFAAPAPAPVLPVPANLRGIQTRDSDALDQWKLIPSTAQWPKNLAAAWQVGESAAGALLHDFIEKNLLAYATTRDRPDMRGTSRLSPYLHFGHLSPRQVWHAVHKAQARSASFAPGAERYLLEILWREFSWHLLHHFPDITTQPLQKSFAAFPWREDKAGLGAWQQGLTGYPIVDAGMRELWQTGWMHNRVRMIAASFLIKDLLIDWREGTAWFWDTLVDADLGSNTASWQWVAGCGADAAPYFRVFNPVLQGQKFDPRGDYVRHFVPELARLDNQFIHEPWKVPPHLLAESSIVLGKTYPFPIVSHDKARLRALEALKISKGESPSAAKSGDLFDKTWVTQS